MATTCLCGSLTQLVVMVIAVVLAVTLGLTSGLDQNEVKAYLRDVSPVWETDREPDLGPSWGLQDAVAVAGKVFKYALPQDLHDNIQGYEVTEKGRPGLPSWLEHHVDEGVLQGVPGAQEVGRELHIQVVPVTADNTTLAKDMFTIRVTEDSPYTDTSAVPLTKTPADKLQPIRCTQGSSVTMVTVVVDTDLSVLGAGERVGLVEGLCEHLGLAPGLVRLGAVGHKPMFDSLALVAGPGDVKQPQHSGATLQWEVGCGNVYAHHMAVLQQLENTAHDGSMGRAVGVGVVGWHVTNHKPAPPTAHSKHARVKRRAYIQPTSTPDLQPPLPTRHLPQPHPSASSSESEEWPYPHPASRTVPSLASPTFPEIKPTQSEHSHHHHHHTRGPKSQGRHHHHATPASVYSSHSQLPVLPTPTLHPVMPTRVIDPSESPSGGHVIPPPVPDPSSPGVSRTGFVIEPSQTLPAITETTRGDITPSRTAPLPSDREGSSTEPVVHPTDTSSPSSSSPTRPDGFTPPTHAPPSFTRPAPAWTPPPDYEGGQDSAPEVKGDGIRRLEVELGNVLDFRIPEDNFRDEEDGNTRDLHLTLTFVDSMGLTPDFWLRFDPAEQRLYGLPYLQEHVGKTEYALSAYDSQGNLVRDIFEISVRGRTGERRITHEMSVVLGLEYARFEADVEERIAIVRRLAQAFGDSDPSRIQTTSVKPGSVVYSWTNTSVPTGPPCPEGALLSLTGKMVDPDGSINPEFRENMAPYEVRGAAVDFRGSCQHMEGVSAGEVDRPAGGGDSDPVITEPKTSEQDVLVTTVAPAVVIAAMLLLGALIACILYRKRRKGKLSDEDQHTFIQKGIPIILPDELDDRPDPPTKPLIMSEERPPQPPPHYPHSPSPSTLRSTHKEPLPDTDDDDDDRHSSPLYRPPPPMSGSLGRHRNPPRPRTPLSQRGPPQYMSPISP